MVKLFGYIWALLVISANIAHAASQQQPIQKKVWDLAGLPIYDYAVEDFRRRYFPYYYSRYQKFLPSIKSGSIKGHLEGTKVKIYVTEEDGIIYRFHFSRDRSKSSLSTVYATLPYGLRVNMNPAEVQKVLGVPNRIDDKVSLKTDLHAFEGSPKYKEIISSEYSDLSWEEQNSIKLKNQAKLDGLEENFKYEVRSKTLYYDAKGVEAGFVEVPSVQRGYSMSYLIYEYPVKRQTPVFKRGTQGFQGKQNFNCEKTRLIKALNAGLASSQKLYFDGRYKETENLANQLLFDFDLYRKSCRKPSVGLDGYHKFNKLLFYRGSARLGLGRKDEASVDLRYTLTNGFGRSEYLYVLGLAELSNGKVERAKQRLKDLRTLKEVKLAKELENEIIRFQMKQKH